VIAQGAPAEVQRNPEVNRAYLGSGDVGDLRRAFTARPLARGSRMMDWLPCSKSASPAGQRRPVRAGSARLRDGLQGHARGEHAIGEMLMAGAYLFFTFAAMFALPIWLAIPAAVLAAGVLGAVIERTMIRPLLGEPPISVFMVTVGLGSVLVGLVEVIWSADQRRLPDFMPSDPIMVGEAFLAPKVFWGAVIAVVFIAAVLLLFRFWRGGVALRATASDQAAAYSVGINVPRVFSLSWVVGAMIAAVSGIIVGRLAASRQRMGVFGLSVLVVVIVGGLDSVLGAWSAAC
jgi:branched-subunit amino acid ABC-type transport system permease component